MARIIELPGIGRFAVEFERNGKALTAGSKLFTTNLTLDWMNAKGKVLDHVDLGSGVVTTAGVNYMAADFLAASTNRINAFKYHDSGTGITAEATSQTALVTPSGVARVAGTDTNPTANQYRSVATITYASALAITEWGLFSASTVGTMWDRRLFSAINVANGDSIQFTYTLTINAGG